MKTFFNLVQDVQKKRICHRCGGCVTFCTAINYGALKIDSDGKPIFADMEKCIECGLCYSICPETNDLEEDTRCQAAWSEPMGRVIETTVVRASVAPVREKATNGGAVTALLLHLFDRNRIDGAIVTRPVGKFQREPHLATTREEILNSAGLFLDTSHGMQHIEEAVAKGTGGILLMSHMGNWEVAAHLLKRNLKDLRLLLYMGIREKEQIERMQKEALVQSGIRIIAVEKDGGSPMDLVEGIRFIESGGVVSMTGDLVWKTEQRTVPVQFLGQEILIPKVPHVLALLAGTPIFTFFAFRTAKYQYQFTMSEPIYVQAASRKDRKAAIRQSAQAYAQALEEALRRYPLQWYHFKPFYKPENIH